MRLSKAGFVALLSDGVGFFTLRVIDIPVIRELAVVASTGIAVLVLTNLVLLPLVLSYTGITDRCVRYRARQGSQCLLPLAAAEQGGGARPGADDHCRLYCLFGVGIWYGQNQQIGDLDPGAPELRPDSRYNMDNAFLTRTIPPVRMCSWSWRGRGTAVWQLSIYCCGRSLPD
jgi:predicted RND superfamily exporter protein